MLSRALLITQLPTYPFTQSFAGDLLGHAAGYRMSRIEENAQQRSGNVEVSSSFGSASGQHISYRQVEFFSAEGICGARQRDERPAFLNKILERLQAFFADPAAI